MQKPRPNLKTLLQSGAVTTINSRQKIRGCGQAFSTGNPPQNCTRRCLRDLAGIPISTPTQSWPKRVGDTGRR